MGLRSRVPESVRAMARPVVWRLSDAAAKTRGTLVPPRRLVSQVPGEFGPVGREFLGYFRDLGHLLPNQRVLDIGCGPGRMAIPLTTYLSNQGSYEGVDTWSEAVEWCQENITPRFGNFGFRSIENLGPVSGSTDASIASVTFPFEDGSFEFAILVAISQLDERTFRSYMSEAGRLLGPGGTYLGTCFLRDGSPGQGEPEDRLYVSETELQKLLGSRGLRLDAVYRGRWDNHPDPLSYQDIVVATKVG